MGGGTRRGVVLVWVVTGEARRWGTWNATARDAMMRWAGHVGHDGQGVMDALAPLPCVVFWPRYHGHADLHPQPALPKQDARRVCVVAVDLELLAHGHRHNTALAHDVLARRWAGHNAQHEQRTHGMRQPELLLRGLFLR